MCGLDTNCHLHDSTIWVILWNLQKIGQMLTIDADVFFLCVCSKVCSKPRTLLFIQLVHTFLRIKLWKDFYRFLDKGKHVCFWATFIMFGWVCWIENLKWYSEFLWLILLDMYLFFVLHLKTILLKL